MCSELTRGLGTSWERRNGELFLVCPSDGADPHPRPWLISEHVSSSCVSSSELWHLVLSPRRFPSGR